MRCVGRQASSVAVIELFLRVTSKSLGYRRIFEEKYSLFSPYNSGDSSKLFPFDSWRLVGEAIFYASLIMPTACTGSSAANSC